MASRAGKAPAKGKKPAGKEEKAEDILKAVVSAIQAVTHLSQHLPQLTDPLQILADYFQDRFVPFTLEKPRVGALPPRPCAGACSC